MFFSIFLVLSLPILVYWYLTKNFNYWTKRGLKGPKPLPIFGNVLDILFNPRDQLELDYYSKYGNLYGYYLGKSPVLVVGEPELVKLILVKDFNIFPVRRSVSAATSHPIMRRNIANVVGDDWKRIRSITSPSFTSNKMKLMYPLMEKCINDFMLHIDVLAKAKSNVNVKDMFGNLTLDVVASAAFGTQLNSRNELDSLFVKHARNLFRINPLKTLLLRIFPKSFFKMIGIQPDSSSDESNNFYIGVVQQIIQNRKQNGVKVNDFLQLLMDADQSTTSDNEIDFSESHHVNEGKEELEIEKKVLNVKFNSSNKKLNEDEVIAQSVTFMMAGYETTAMALTYATYELALNPQVQDKLYDEINESLNSNNNIDYEILCRLPYLDSVICEALRHHSPVIKTNRIASQDYKVGDTGITLYKGQLVDIPIHGIHHDEKYYTNPFQFNPDRFMPQNRHNLVPYTYLPFGGGPRNCIGMRFALLETKLALAQMVRKYKFFKCNETDVPLLPDRKAMLNVPIRAVVGIEMRN